MAKFAIKYTPTRKAQQTGARPATRTVFAPGWKAALNESDRAFDLHQVRFINHPGNPGVGVAYDANGQVVGQVTAVKEP